ncbi:MAG TPA: hypothetical protein VGC39_09465, partial [Candidatus Methylacidiphilales bacterium]
MSRFLIATCIGFLFVLTFPPSMAAPADNSDAAMAMARAWLTQIDAAQYDDSYTAGCIAFHEKVS